MKKIASIIIALFIASSVAGAQTKEDSIAVATAQWEKTELAEGLVYNHLQFNQLYGGAQNICFLEINPRRFRIGIKDHSGMEKTSVKAAEAGAVAAVNGTFYDMDKGNSVCYLQIAGQMLDTTERGEINILMTGAVKIKNGRLSVIDWSREIEKGYREKASSSPDRNISVIAALPRLLKNGEYCSFPELKGFSSKKHPRTAILLGKNKIYFLVVDGRAKGNAKGVTLPELRQMAAALGAKDAINMDGGGSSTLWYRGDPISGISGVLNMPCDNDKFDHKGERSISNSICVFAK